MAGAQACVNQEATGGAVLAQEDQRCNGSLHKKSLSQPGTEDSGGQRYSADPTIFLGERVSRGDTDEDGYMTPMKEKHSSGTHRTNQHSGLSRQTNNQKLSQQSVEKKQFLRRKFDLYLLPLPAW